MGRIVSVALFASIFVIGCLCILMFDEFMLRYGEITMNQQHFVISARNCAFNPPDPSDRLQSDNCQKYQTEASRWIWWMTLVQVLRSYWVCEIYECRELLPLLEKYVSKIILFAFIILGIYVYRIVFHAKKNVDKKSYGDEDESERLHRLQHSYPQAQAPTIVLLGDMQRQHIPSTAPDTQNMFQRQPKIFSDV